jgi:hypothetical protein
LYGAWLARLARCSNSAFGSVAHRLLIRFQTKEGIANAMQSMAIGYRASGCAAGLTWNEIFCLF